jgi:RimJ/RimL family protein N-acetyltransferase
VTGASGWQPRLTGELVALQPLSADDFPRLFAVASDPAIWAQHPARDRYQEPVFREFFAGALMSNSAFLVLDRATGQAIGSTRFANYDADRSEVEIGWTFLARSHWGGRYNAEMKRLMLDYAFRQVRRVYFVIGEGNVRSRTAVERLGAVLADERLDRDLHGTIVRHVVYEIRR